MDCVFADGLQYVSIIAILYKVVARHISQSILHYTTLSTREVPSRLTYMSQNAAQTGETWILDESSADLRMNLELSVVALYTVSQWAMPKLLQIAHDKTYKPALIVTSGWLANAPEPNYFALGVCKSAQQNIVHSLNDQLRSRGVHCGLVMVDDTVTCEAWNTNPTNIAEECWQLYDSQGNGKMELETHIREDGGKVQPTGRTGT